MEQSLKASSIFVTSSKVKSVVAVVGVAVMLVGNAGVGVASVVAAVSGPW